MSISKKITSINKRLNTIFKDIRRLPFEDINKVLFNIELLKNEYLHRTKQGDYELYEGQEEREKLRKEANTLKLIIRELRENGELSTIEHKFRPLRDTRGK